MRYRDGSEDACGQETGQQRLTVINVSNDGNVTHGLSLRNIYILAGRSTRPKIVRVKRGVMKARFGCPLYFHEQPLKPGSRPKIQGESAGEKCKKLNMRAMWRRSVMIFQSTLVHINLDPNRET